MSDADMLEQINRKLTAILALLCDDRDGSTNEGEPGSSRRKTISILSEAGLKNPEIAPILGKKENAVRVAVQRSRKTALAAKGDQNGKDEP